MANQFYTIKKSKKNVKFLKKNGFSKLPKAVLNEEEKYLIINTSERNYYTACLESVLDAKVLIDERFAQQLITINKIESCLN